MPTTFSRAVFILFLLAGPLYFQEARADKADSLRNLVKTAGEDTNKVKWLNELYRAISFIGETRSEQISLLEKALDLSKKLNFKKGLTYTYNNLGIYYKNLGNSEKALENYQLSQQVAVQINDVKGMARAYNNIGLIYDATANYPEAIKNYMLAMKYGEQSGFTKVVSSAMANTAILYRKQGELDKAEKYFNDALRLFISSKDALGEAYVCANLAGIYKMRKEFDKAEDLNKRAIALEEKLGDESGLAGSYIDMGSLAVDRAQVLKAQHKTGEAELEYDRAIKYFEQAVPIYTRHGEVSGLITAWENTGETYFIMGKYDKALPYCLRSLDSAMKYNYLEQIGTSQKALSLIYEGKKNPDLAYKYYKKYIDTRDSLYNEANSKKIIQSQLQFDYDKKEAIAQAEQEKKDLAYNEEVKRQKLTIYSVISGLVIVIVFSFFLYNRFRITKRQNLIIEEQKTVVEEKNREIVDSINYAKYLQDAILPPDKFIKEQFADSFVLFKPKDIVAGDFYWMETSGEKILIAAADCTGHGVPGAMVSVVCSNALNRSVKEFGIVDPGKILDKVRELVLETFQKSERDVKDGMDISLAVWDKKEGSLKWAGANNPLWFTSSGEVKEIVANKQPIGRTDNPKPFTTHSVPLQKGSSFYLFTDGYADQFGGPKGKKFKYRQLEEMLTSFAGMQMEEQKVALDAKIDDWRGELGQVDDVLVIGIRV